MSSESHYYSNERPELLARTLASLCFESNFLALLLDSVLALDLSFDIYCM